MLPVGPAVHRAAQAWLTTSFYDFYFQIRKQIWNHLRALIMVHVHNNCTAFESRTQEWHRCRKETVMGFKMLPSDQLNGQRSIQQLMTVVLQRKLNVKPLIFAKRSANYTETPESPDCVVHVLLTVWLVKIKGDARQGGPDASPSSSLQICLAVWKWKVVWWVIVASLCRRRGWKQTIYTWKEATKLWKYITSKWIRKWLILNKSPFC